MRQIHATYSIWCHMIKWNARHQIDVYYTLIAHYSAVQTEIPIANDSNTAGTFIRATTKNTKTNKTLACLYEYNFLKLFYVVFRTRHLFLLLVVVFLFCLLVSFDFDKFSLVFYIFIFAVTETFIQNCLRLA